MPPSSNAHIRTYLTPPTPPLSSMRTTILITYVCVCDVRQCSAPPLSDAIAIYALLVAGGGLLASCNGAVSMRTRTCTIYAYVLYVSVRYTCEMVKLTHGAGTAICTFIYLCTDCLAPLPPPPSTRMHTRIRMYMPCLN